MAWIISHYEGFSTESQTQENVLTLPGPGLSHGTWAAPRWGLILQHSRVPAAQSSHLRELLAAVLCTL